MVRAAHQAFITCILVALVASSAMAQDAASSAQKVDVEAVRAEAENGDSGAQVALASYYYFGLGGLAKDNAESIKWLLKAGEQGNPRAEYDLSAVYFYGHAPAAKDYVQSYMWLSLMLTQNNPKAVALHERALLRRDKLEANMSTDQIVQARAAAKAWVKAHADLPKEFLPVEQ